MNAAETLSISYQPTNPGTQNTRISFYKGEPDLAQIFDGGDGARRVFVTDDTIAALPSMRGFMSRWQEEGRAFKPGFFARRGRDALLVLGSGEPYKTIDCVLQIVRLAIDENMPRSAVFTGIGGGVICDMTAFAAAIFKRGAKAEFVPTTLLAMVDAAVGGKAGCDFSNYKNMIGSFWPAQHVHYFSRFVLSLPEVQYRSGLAEAFKTAYLYSADLLKEFRTKKEEILGRDPEILDRIITACAKAKARVVEEDFTEQGVRAYLNYGHTFAHALESACGLGTVSHGDAVAWGMGRASVLACKLGLCTAEYRDQMLDSLREYGWETGAIHTALSSFTPDEAASMLIEAMKKDKKITDGAIRFVLQRDVEQTLVQTVGEADILAVLNPAAKKVHV